MTNKKKYDSKLIVIKMFAEFDNENVRVFFRKLFYNSKWMNLNRLISYD